jgi:hypothetical protein
MPRINFVIARTDEEAQELANDGRMGCSTMSEACNTLKSLVALQTTTPVALAPSGKFTIYAVKHEVKRLRKL